MSILILGSPQDTHAALIARKIQARGHQALYLDTLDFPGALKLNLTIGPGTSGLGQCIDPSGNRTMLDDIEAVYWRSHMGISLPDIEEPYLREMAYREIESTLGSLFRSLPCRWVNSPEAVNMHVFKTYQLTLLNRAGIRIPRTLITNDPDAVREFYESQNGQVIYKPVRGGAHTQKLSKDDLSDARLAELSKSPVQFQELIEGVDIRAYCMQDEIFAAEIHSGTLDFRDDPGAPIVPIALPQTVQQDCYQLASLLKLLYTGIDIRRTPQGEYVFLEGNPCPMFIYFEQQTGYPISDRLVDLLLKPLN